jgi:putative PEP-CTERM system histidine kinase
MWSTPLPLAYGIAALVYGALALLLVRGFRGGLLGWVFLGSVVITVLWALAGSALTVLGIASEPLLNLATAVRNVFWLALVYMLWRYVAAGESVIEAMSRPMAHCGIGLAVLFLALVSFASIHPMHLLAVQLGQIALLAFAVLGLVLVDSFRGSCKGSELWAVKHLLIGLGGLFAYDLFVSSEALLLRQIGEATRLAQPLVAAMIAPLLAVAAHRLRDLRIALPISRQLVLQTTGLLLSGFYLLAVAGAGFLLRALGMQWGAALQLVFGFAAGLVLVIVIGSGELRARGRRFVGRHFFEFAYDYRREWLRFVATMAGGKDRRPLHERALQAVADPLECTGGFLYLRERGSHWRLAAEWNWSPPSPLLAPPGELLDCLADQPILLADWDEIRTMDGDWLRRFGDVWFVLAVAAHGRMVGFMIMGKPRAGRVLTSEDRDLLKILSVQIAGYLTEEQTITALAEARRFERMSKNFSFIAHDLKNIVSQLSLILQQAKRRGDNPAFIRDALDTVGHSVEKMRAMLLRLRDRADGNGMEMLDLGALLADIVQRKRIIVENLAFENEVADIKVVGSKSAIAAILENLVDNAREAGGPQVNIKIRVGRDTDMVLVDVLDDGPGMTAEFVQDHLFQPFMSTKADGFGIGMYQCREWLESWGGGLDVDSRLGKGTTVRMRLPAAARSRDDRCAMAGFEYV